MRACTCRRRSAKDRAADGGDGEDEENDELPDFLSQTGHGPELWGRAVLC